MLAPPRDTSHTGFSPRSIVGAQTYSDPVCGLTSDAGPTPGPHPLIRELFLLLFQLKTLKDTTALTERRGCLPNQWQLCGLPKSHPHCILRGGKEVVL